MICFVKFLAGRLRSFTYAFSGLLSALKSEGNTRVHMLATAVVIGLGLGFGITRLEWAALAAAIGLVWVAELLNTALEQLCDVVEPARSNSIRQIKDISAAAVLLAALAAAVIGALVFGPHIYT